MFPIVLLFVAIVGALAQDVAEREFVDGNRQFTAAVYKVSKKARD